MPAARLILSCFGASGMRQSSPPRLIYQFGFVYKPLYSFCCFVLAVALVTAQTVFDPKSFYKTKPDTLEVVFDEFYPAIYVSYHLAAYPGSFHVYKYQSLRFVRPLL